MSDTCEFLERRGAGDEESFDGERPYCTAVDAFVQPMRADICAKRYGLDPETDCEFYREAKGLGSITGFEADGENDSGAEEAGS
ncbi:hypothetical protein [Halolamina sp. C58]|uniref:hypothetical protein n=1 Tax=Halolamina sp. C58 TaxID=3421640 RepID=UPI003EBE7B16